MSCLPLRIDGATSSFKAPLVVLQDRTGSCPIQRQKESNADDRSYCQFTGFISEKLTFEMPCVSIDFLTTSSPAEGKVRSIGVTAAGGESAHRV